MVKGITESGIEFEIDEQRLDNMELVDALEDLQGGDPLAVSTVSKLLLSPEMKEKIYSELKEQNDGRVPVTAFSNVLTDIFVAIGAAGKKS